MTAARLETGSARERDLVSILHVIADTAPRGAQVVAANPAATMAEDCTQFETGAVTEAWRRDVSGVDRRPSEFGRRA